MGRPYVRLTQPLVRDTKGAPLRPAGWDEALDRVVAGLGVETSMWQRHTHVAAFSGTCLRIAAAIEHPSSGTAYVLGERLGRVDMADLRDGQRVLDIGCGWGGLAIHALVPKQMVEVLQGLVDPAEGDRGGGQQRRQAHHQLGDGLLAGAEGGELEGGAVDVAGELSVGGEVQVGTVGEHRLPAPVDLGGQRFELAPEFERYPRDELLVERAWLVSIPT